jgi:hypothetical protein
MRSAQHISYEAFIGSVEKGILVMQTCRNRLCINPNTSRRSIRGGDGFSVSRRLCGD